MKRKLITILLGLSSGVAFTTYADQLKLNPYLEFRPRYEFVDVSNSANKDANALTIRTKIGVKIDKLLNLENLEAQLEAIDVSAVIDNYAPEKSGYELVQDPSNTRLTQAFLSYNYNNYTFIAGRKYINIDDHRFIGNVDWRQMPQSFGVVALSGKPLNNLNFLIAGIYERKGIIDSLNTDWHMDKMPIIADFNYNISEIAKIKLFSYLITDFHNTYGIKINGNKGLNNFKLSYLLEYAKQTDPYQKDNLVKKPKIDTDYWRIGVNSNIKGFILGAEYTHFGDKNGKDRGFSTPFATLHKFEGWSDVLLEGAANGFDYGLNEYVISGGYESASFGKFVVSYLLFKSYKSSPNGKDIGSEIDTEYSKKLTKRISFLAKAAFYNAKDGYITRGNLRGGSDVKKVWLQIEYKF